MNNRNELVLAGGLLLLCGVVPACADGIVDYTEPAYGGRIRQMLKSDGHEHNIYYHRNPFNADHSYMIGIQSDLNQNNWQVVLYDGDGVFIKSLFTLSQYDWRLAWDRNDPAILYTWKQSLLYKYNVNTGTAVVLKDFSPGNVGVGGPSLNQAGDRIMIITTDHVFHTFHLPDMTDERTFTVTLPPGTSSDWEDERYIGYGNYIVARASSTNEQHTYIYQDDGTLYHHFNGYYMGHTDFSPDGRWAYFKWPTGGRPLSNFEIHVVNIDGTGDTLLFSLTGNATVRSGRNVHLSWPDHVTNWFIAAFEPVDTPPSPYAPPRDEIMMFTQLGTSWTWQYLARTETVLSSGFTEFWSEPLASPSPDGTRISFNSSRSGTVDQFILYPLLVTGGSTLPVGVVAQSYSQTLAATGGNPPYTWSQGGGTLPPGLTLNGAGVVNGTPTASGTYTFTVKVTDAVGVTNQQFTTLAVIPGTCSLSIGAVAPRTVQLTWNSVLGTSYQVQYGTNLTAWQNAGPPITGTGAVLQFVDDGTYTGSPPGTDSPRFYRLQLTP